MARDFTYLVDKEPSPVHKGNAEFIIRETGFKPKDRAEMEKVVQLVLTMNAAYQKSDVAAKVREDVAAARKAGEKKIVDKVKKEESKPKAKATRKPAATVKKAAAKRVTKTRSRAAKHHVEVEDDF